MEKHKNCVDRILFMFIQRNFMLLFMLMLCRSEVISLGKALIFVLQTSHKTFELRRGI